MCAPHIVCCIINAEDAVPIKAIVLEKDVVFASFIIYEYVAVSICRELSAKRFFDARNKMFL